MRIENWVGKKDTYNSLIVVINTYKGYPEEREIIKKRLHEEGIKAEGESFQITATLESSMNSVELCLSTYFKAQKEAFEFIRHINKDHAM